MSFLSASSLKARSHFRSSRRVMFPVIASPFPPQRIQNRAGGTLEVGGGGHHRPSRGHRPWGYAPAASSTGETSGTFPSRTVPRASLESAEEVEVYELYHVAPADGLISLTKEVTASSPSRGSHPTAPSAAPSLAGTSHHRATPSRRRALRTVLGEHSKPLAILRRLAPPSRIRHIAASCPGPIFRGGPRTFPCSRARSSPSLVRHLTDSSS